VPEQSYPTDPNRFFATEGPAGPRPERLTPHQQNHLSPADLLALSRVKPAAEKEAPAWTASHVSG
jgi:hypothetical protein